MSGTKAACAAFAVFTAVAANTVLGSAWGGIRVEPDPMTMSAHDRKVPALIKNRPLLAVRFEHPFDVEEALEAEEARAEAAFVAPADLSVHGRGVPSAIKNRPMLAVTMQVALEREAKLRSQSQLAAAKGDRLTN